MRSNTERERLFKRAPIIKLNNPEAIDNAINEFEIIQRRDDIGDMLLDINLVKGTLHNLQKEPTKEKFSLAVTRLIEINAKGEWRNASPDAKDSFHTALESALKALGEEPILKPSSKA